MIYMNNAATSWPKPSCVPEAVAKAIFNPPGEHLRGGFSDFDVFEEVRKALMPVLGVTDSSRIALGPNATWALNQAIFGLDLREGDTVVTTKAEHNSVLRPLYRLSQQGIRIIYVETDEQGRVDPEKWKLAIERYHPRLSVFTHASNVTGAVNDAALLCKIAKSVNSIILIDSSQTIGCIPLDSELIGAEMAAFTGHKYLLGPQGTGGLWIRKGLELTPRLVGGTGIKSDLSAMPEEMPVHLEAGTGNEPSFCGLLAALRWQQKNPFSYTEIMNMLSYLAENLSSLGANVIFPSGIKTPVISFTLPGINASEIGFQLKEGCEICCRTGLHCAPKIFSCLGVPETVRLSLSRFTSKEEIHTVVSSVEAIIK